MPMADQQRRPLSINGHGHGATTATESSITCRTCGCLNFSEGDDCDRCRKARASVPPSPVVPVVRHPFLPTVRPANANANGPSRPVLTASSPSPAGVRLLSAVTNVMRVTSDAKENAYHLQRTNEAAGNGQGIPARSGTSKATNQSVRENAESKDQEPKNEASEVAVGAKTIRPGSSLLEPSPMTTSSSTFKAGHDGTIPGVPFSSCTPVTTVTTTTSGSLASAVGGKRLQVPPLASSEREIIDLISSDEESESHQRRVAKRARQAARQQESFARFALRRVHPEQDGVLEDQRRPELLQGRSFDDVEFNHEDFPTAVEMAQAMRSRFGGLTANTTVSSTVSTPTSASSVPSLARVPMSSTTPATAPTAARLAATSTTPAVAPSLTPNFAVSPLDRATGSASTSTTVSTGEATMTKKTTTAPAGALDPPNTAPSVEDGFPATTKMPSVPIVATGNTPTANLPFLASSSTSSAPAVDRTSASQCPIVVDGSDDDSDEEKNEADEKKTLFQSRRFQSVVFSARDFMTANDGLNLARRSGTTTPLPDPVEANCNDAMSTNPNAPTVGLVATVSQTNEQVPTAATATAIASNGINILQARRKIGSTITTSVAAASGPVPVQLTTVKTEQPSSLRPVGAVEIVKPTLGHCSIDFLQFMRNCVDDDDDIDDDDEELTREKLLAVVDLTNLTDESPDEDDDDDDYFKISEMTSIPHLQPTRNGVGGLSVNASTNAAAKSALFIKDAPDGTAGTSGGNGHLWIVPTKRTRAPRPKETCVLCEEKAWIRALVNCPDCKKYYHKRCAREYGDDSVCWNCDVDGLIDDSELTEDHTNQVVGMFGALRQSSDSELGEDDDNEELEDKADVPAVEDPVSLSSLNAAATRSTRRWKQFLDVSTAPIERNFQTVTNQITQELQDETTKSKYSKGFASKEDFEQGMAQVVDHYADLQDREERSRAPQVEVAEASDPTNTAGATAAEHPPDENMVANPLPPQAPATPDFATSTFFTE